MKDLTWYRVVNGVPVRRQAPAGDRPAVPSPIVGRPSGDGYVRYEDLYRAGDTVTEAMNRCPDGAIITFPEGEFVGVDFPQSQGRISILVPPQCAGIIGSGKGTLGGSTGTVFTMQPNSSTYVPPAQGSSQPSIARVMMRMNGTRGGLFANFQVAGTEQGHPFHGFADYTPYGRTTLQDLLVTGWFGDNGAPPGEAMGITVHGRPGSPAYHGHRMVRCEADSRRVPGGPTYGPVCATYQNTVGGYLIDCNFHHFRTNGWVGYQVFDVETYDCIFDQSSTSTSDILGVNCVNHERTAGCVHYRPQLLRHSTNSGTHMHHSNGHLSVNYDGVERTFTDGSLKVVDPTYSPIWGQNYLYIQSWDPYSWGVGGDSMKTPPLVVKADGVTHLPYKWVHGTTQLIL